MEITRKSIPYKVMLALINRPGERLNLGSLMRGSKLERPEVVAGINILKDRGAIREAVAYGEWVYGLTEIGEQLFKGAK
jgi:hypothetical protein